VNAVSAEFRRLQIADPCLHITTGPAVLAFLKARCSIPQGVLTPVEIVHERPFTASLVESTRPGCLQRVIVRETPHHLLACSIHSQRSYICDHVKQALGAATSAVRSRLKLVEIIEGGEQKVRKKVKPASPDALIGDMKSTAGVAINWPLQLRSIPVSGNLHHPFCCEHKETCLQQCACQHSKLTVLQVCPDLA